MAGFTKLFSSIVTSSLWCQDDTVLRVWIAMLATCDAKGLVEGSVPGFASLCRISIEEMERVLGILSSPDPHSRTEDYEGRRIEKVQGGWLVLNYVAYRERGQDKHGSRAGYMREYRKEHDNTLQKNVTRNTEAEAEAEAEKDKRLPQPSATVVVPPAGAGHVKQPRKPVWSKSHPDEIVNTTHEIVGQWPTPESGAFQPDRKTPVPGVSPSEVATRLAEIQKQGGSLLICARIAERAVREWKTQGKWIKAPQHFFGPAKDAPWKAYYQAEVTNQRLLGEAS